MSWILTWPWAALGFLSVPVLVGLYVLRQRSRRRPVSSLLLWRGEPPQRESGRRIDQFQASRLFWLELAILVLLTLAALGPRVPTEDSRRPLVVVLDDSFSMRAGESSEAPLAKARRALTEEVDPDAHRDVRFIRAGREPELVEGPLRNAVLAAWNATSTTAMLDDAVVLAREVGGPRARVLVVTDQPPPAELREPSLLWWAFGTPRPNLAVVGAVRRAVETTEDDAISTCLVEVRNASTRPAAGQLTVSSEKESLQTLEVSLAPDEVGRYRFTVPAARAVRVDLVQDGDGLSFDDGAVLLPETQTPVIAAVRLADDGTRELIEETLAATGRVRFSTDTNAEPDLVVSRLPASGGDAFFVRLLGEPDAVPYLGPFVVDRTHPLAEGLSLAGAIWAAGTGSQEVGRGAALDTTVVSAGDVPLLVDRPRGRGREILLRFRPDLSTLQRSPDWPILWWNLVAWRAATLPGLEHRNVHLGENVVLRVGPGTESVRWQPPGDAATVDLRPQEDGAVLVRPDVPGIHELLTVRGRERFAVNVLAAEESDLRGAATGRWGSWEAVGADGSDPFPTYRDLSWLFGLAGLALLVLHLFWSKPK